MRRIPPLSTGPGRVLPPANRVLATINGFNVTMPYLNHVVEGQYAREVLDSIVRARVIEDEARANGVSVSSEAVDAMLGLQQKQFGSAEAFATHLQELGYSMKAYREHLRQQLLLSGLMEKAVLITDEEARAYYDAHKAEYSAEAELHIMDIPTASDQDALTAYRALLDGTPFEVVARRYTVQPSPAVDGDLGWVSKDSCAVKGLWDVAVQMKENETAAPQLVDGRQHIVRLAGRRAAGTKPLDEVKGQIKAILREKKGTSEADYVTSLIAKANIKIQWPVASYLEDEYNALKGVRVAVDGKVLRLSPPPFVSPEGGMLVPAKQVLLAVGASLTWHSGAKILEVNRGPINAKISVGEKSANVNGEMKDMKAAAVMKDGALFVAPRVLFPALGVGLEWNNTTKLLSLSTVPPK